MTIKPKYILFLALFCILSTANAQQQPSQIITGVRVPQLASILRDSIVTGDSKDYHKNNAKGQIVYNINNDCLEYWNGTGWVSLCPEDDITLRNACKSDYNYSALPTYTANSIPFNNCDSLFTSVSDYLCNQTLITDSFNVYLIVGVNYASIVRNGAKFSIKFDTNYSELDRTAVVRVVNSCSDEYQDFLFTQKGRGCNDDPLILFANDSTENDYTVCVGASTSPYSYTYLNLINFDKDKINETYWYHNGNNVGRYGISKTLTGNIKDTGEWYVVQGSRVSNKIRLTAKKAVSVTAGLNYDNFTINGETGGIVCINGDSVELKIDTEGKLTPCTIFTWYIDQKIVAETTDSIFMWYHSYNEYYQGMLDVQVGITSLGCFINGTITQYGYIKFVHSPQTPIINNGVSGVTDCSNSEVILRATKPDSSAYSNPWTTEPYEWFLNGNKISTDLTQDSIVANGEGSYTVRFKERHSTFYSYSYCPSKLSEPFVIKKSGKPLAQWLKAPEDSVYQGDVKLYSVITAPDIDTYTWISLDTNIARIISYGNGQNIRVIYTDNATILPKEVEFGVIVRNACGYGLVARRVKVVSK